MIGVGPIPRMAGVHIRKENLDTHREDTWEDTWEDEGRDWGDSSIDTTNHRNKERRE